MPSGIFTLRQMDQALAQGAWPNASFPSSYGAKFNGTGSGQYLTGPTTAALNFGTGNFTVEFWLYISAYGAANLTVAFSASNGGSDFQLSVNAGSQYVYWHNSGIQIAANSASSFTPGRWTHIALVRSGSTASLFCDGTRYGTTTNSASINLTNFYIGSYWNSPTAYMVDGWVSNLRITNTAVYDPTLSTLTLPLGPLTAISGTQLLTLQNATIVDNSANALTITNNGSVPMQVVYPFGGLTPYKTLAVDYLAVAGGGGGGRNWGGGGGAGGLLQGNIGIAAGTSYTVTVGAGGSGGSNDVSNNATSGSNSVFGSITATGGGYGGMYNLQNAASGGSGGGAGSGGTPGIFGQGVFGQGNAGGAGDNGGANSCAGGGGGAGTVGVAATSGSAIAGNGGAGIASDISGTRTTYAGGGGGTSNSGGTAGIGGAGGGGNGGKYGTSNPTAGTANTGGGGGGGQYLSSGGNGGSGIVIISYPDTYAPAVATTGAPIASTSGSGSLYFPTGTNYITTATNAGLALGTSSFTVEFWVNVVNIGTSNQNAVGAGGPGGYNPLFCYTSGSALNLFLSSSGTSWDIANNVTIGAASSNVWHHVAIVRNNTTFYTFLNGVQGATFTSASSIYQTANSFNVGNGQGSTYPFNGYVSNLRVLKGTALYTANFTPPTAPLTAITNTQLLMNTVSGAFTADSSANSLTPTGTGTLAWSALSPFATGLGYKNRVYTWTSSGSITF